MSDPLWMNADPTAQTPSYDAQEIRQAMSVLFYGGGDALTARSGLRPGPGKDGSLQGLWPTLSGDQSSLTISPGSGIVQGTSNALQGAYMCSFTEALTLEIPAASDANPRMDRVVLRVYDDDQDATDRREATVEYLPGIADTQPVAPQEPDNALSLALLTVPAGGGKPTIDTSVRQYAVASGGIVPVRDATERDALPSVHYGAAIFRLDQHVIECWTNRGWRLMLPPDPGLSRQPGTVNPNKDGTWVDFTDAQFPAIDFTVPSSGRLWVNVSAEVQNTNTLQSTIWCGWRMSGDAGTHNPSSYSSVGSSGGRTLATRRRFLWGLTPGARGRLTPCWWVSSHGSGQTTQIYGGELTIEYV